MNRLEKASGAKIFDETIKTLNWRRAVLWKEIDRLQPYFPGDAERVWSRIIRIQGELENDFKRAHKILAERRRPEKQSQKPKGWGWGIGVFVCFFSMTPAAWAEGIVSQGLDVTGEIIALPFHIVAEAFRLVF